uniref:ATP synthase subunit a n=1 Tax=Herdmania momus TaxID=7733 RepID=D1GKX4_HERMO|nr:ATP synthase F0 subunit 6 [Herdmania momus]CAX65565.1 ATP synthase F0 subunit 6 [Herdmania momus]
MFSFFESSFFMGIPLGVLFSLMVLGFFMPILKQVKFGSFLGILASHYSNSTYPGLLLVLYLFFSVLFLNMYGLVPMSFSVTSLPMVTLGFGFVFWGGGYLYCLFNNYENFVAHFLPLGTPQALQVVLVWIELLSWLCRPVALGVRLMANITAGHLLLILVGQGVFYVGVLGLFVSVVLVGLVMLEVGVGVIQSYVYNLLLSLYMNEGLE